MNNSLKYIIPIVIVLLGLIFWFFKCPWCILLPLLFMLGAGYLGWRIGLSGVDEKVLDMETQVTNYKNQLTVANTSVNTGTTAASSANLTLINEKHNSELTQRDKKYNDLFLQNSRLNQEWETKYRALRDSKNSVVETTDWDSKYSSLLLEKEQLNQEWEVKYQALRDSKNSVVETTDWDSKYSSLLLEKEQLNQEWESKYNALANSKERSIDASEDSDGYNTLLIEKDKLNKEWESRYAVLQSKVDDKSASSDGKDWKSKYKALKEAFNGESWEWKSEKSSLLARLSEAPREVIREIEIIKEVPVIREIEVIKEVPVEIIKEVEVIKSIDLDSLEDMMSSMKQVEVSRTEKSSKSKSLKNAHHDDLTKIDGIGKIVSKLLQSQGIYTYKKLAKLKKSALLGILDAGGKRFRLIDPKSWSSQAELASKEDWKALKKMQDKL